MSMGPAQEQVNRERLKTPPAVQKNKLRNPKEGKPTRYSRTLQQGEQKRKNHLALWGVGLGAGGRDLLVVGKPSFGGNEVG